MNILFVGDLVSPKAIEVLSRALLELKRTNEIDLVIANGENIHAHNGISESQFQDLLYAGADIVTLGNHTWDQKAIYHFIEDERLVRPFNYPESAPGQGYRITYAKNRMVAVISAMGNVNISTLESPFLKIDEVIEKVRALGAKHIIVEIHAEATAEKRAFGFYLDGKVSAVLGTHTHVPTADEMILPKKTAYQTDVGMVGPKNSVIGMESERSIARFTSQRRVNYKQAEDKVYEFNAVLLELGTEGEAVSIKRIRKEIEV